MSVLPEVAPPAAPGPVVRRSFLRRVGRAIAELLGSGPVLGAALGAIGFGYEIWTRPDFAVFGKRNKAIEDLVSARFAGQVRADQLRILVFMVVVGVLVATAAALLGRVFDAARTDPPLWRPLPDPVPPPRARPGLGWRVLRTLA